jgi:hypothetical protein
VERKNGCAKGGKRKVEAWTKKIVPSILYVAMDD